MSKITLPKLERHLYTAVTIKLDAERRFVPNSQRVRVARAQEHSTDTDNLRHHPSLGDLGSIFYTAN